MRRFENPIYVTSPLLPDEGRLAELTAAIFRRRFVTNHGQCHNALEAALRKKLQAPLVMLFSNGTMALMTALRVMKLPPGSEVITTPFTFPATPHAISWIGLTPIFCDINPNSFCLDADQVESHITSRTSAILSVHAYGFSSDLEKLETIGRKYNLRVIYDGSHCFDSSYRGKHIGLWGDITSQSYHATKLFNTFEGGSLVSPNVELERPIYYARNFGIKNEEEVVEIGINGKMNEMNAAVGLLNLDCYDGEKAKRAKVRGIYDEILQGNPSVHRPQFPEHLDCSEQYYVMQVGEGARLSRNDLYDTLRDQYNVHARKYFHPACYDYTPYRTPLARERFPNTHAAANSNLCLPFYGDLLDGTAERIAQIVTHLL